MKLKAVHKVLKFKQGTCLKKYIEFNTEVRKTIPSSDESARDIPKLKNNAIYGKTVENIRKRKKLVFATSEDKCQKMIK